MEIRKGGNCDVEINRENGCARKVLRNTSNKSKIQRFRTEIQIAELLKNIEELSIARVIETHTEPNIKKCYILMKFYEYNLGDFLDKTKGRVRYTFSLLLPIIKTLNTLSRLEKPIYHRDLKPENILSDGESLFLSDFGIAYLDDGEDRITTTLEAVGARLFLAPEYEIGKAEAVDEKGDIYSLGKIIWYLINGEKNELLPYNLWFEDRFDLLKKFPKEEGIAFANYVIMNCLETNPSKWISYPGLINSIERFLSNDSSIVDEEYEERIEINFRKKELASIEQEKKYGSFLFEVAHEINLLSDRIHESEKLSQKIKDIIRHLRIDNSIISASRNGPVSMLSSFSDANILIRIAFDGNPSRYYVSISFYSKKSLLHHLYKPRIYRTNNGLMLDDKEFDRTLFYKLFLKYLNETIVF